MIKLAKVFEVIRKNPKEFVAAGTGGEFQDRNVFKFLSSQ